MQYRNCSLLYSVSPIVEKCDTIAGYFNSVDLYKRCSKDISRIKQSIQYGDFTLDLTIRTK